MKKILTAFIFLSLLPLASGAEIACIFVCQQNVDAEVGQRLTVPCKFNLNNLIEDPTIDIEWGIIKDDNSYHPVMHKRETRLLTGGQKGHIKPNWKESNQGDCSLVFDPIQQGDAGTYMMRLSVNGGQHQDSAKITVHVKKSQQTPKESSKDNQGLSTKDLSGERHTESAHGESGRSTNDKSKVPPMKPNAEKSGPSTKDNSNVLPKKSNAKESGPSKKDKSKVLPRESDAEESGSSADSSLKHPFFNEKHSKADKKDQEHNEKHSLRANDNHQRGHKIEDEVMKSARMIKDMKNNGSLISLVIFVVVILLVIPVIYGIATLFWVRYRQLVRKSKDSVVSMEEALDPETSREEI